MPWKTNSEEEQRWGFVQLALRAKLGLAELCRRTGISRKTACKWTARFQKRGRGGLRDKARHPYWGAPKIHWVLQRQFGRKGLPSEAAISRWLKHWGLTRRRSLRLRKGPVILRSSLTIARPPNEVWTVDFKGFFRTGDGTKVSPLTVRALASRYILDFCLLRQQTVEASRVAMESIFPRFGLPQVIRVDNGSPFGATGALGLTRLSAWWVKLGLTVEFTEPGHPEQNGAHEQMHRIYKAETLRPPAGSLRGQNRRARQWYWEYNYKRPHEALGMGIPARYYRKSRRKLPERLRPWKHPGEWLGRLAKGKGMISLNGRGR